MSSPDLDHVRPDQAGAAARGLHSNGCRDRGMPRRVPSTTVSEAVVVDA